MFDLTISNPYRHAINFSDKGFLHPVTLQACFFKGDSTIEVERAPESFKQISLKPGQSTHYKFVVTAPRHAGQMELLFSLQTDPFPGSKNSKIITFTVK